MLACALVSSRHSATSASFPASSEPIWSSQPSTRAPPMVASSRPSRTVSAWAPPAARANSTECLSSSTRDAASFEAAPSTPSPTGTPAECRSRVRQIPAPSRALTTDSGRCRSASRPRPDGASSKWIPWANQTSGPSQPRDATYSTGEQPNFSRQKSSSSTVSARWVCSRTPFREPGRRPASTARRSPRTASRAQPRSAASSPVTGRDAGRSPRLSPRGSRRSPRRRGPAGVRPCSRRGPSSPAWAGTAARPYEPPRSRRPADRRRRREDVVVVHRGRAAGPGELDERSGRARAHRVLVEAAPDRVERREPLEQRVVDGEAAGQPLVEVMVGVDQSRRGQAAGAVDVRRGASDRWGARPSATVVIRLPSTTTCPTAYSARSPSMVTTAQPSITCVIGDPQPLMLPAAPRRDGPHR